MVKVQDFLKNKCKLSIVYTFFDEAVLSMIIPLCLFNQLLERSSYSFFVGDYQIKHKITIAAVAFMAGFATLYAIIMIFEIDLVKWVNCSGLFSTPEDKKSEICRKEG